MNWGKFERTFDEYILMVQFVLVLKGVHFLVFLLLFLYRETSSVKGKVFVVFIRMKIKQ